MEKEKLTTCIRSLIAFAGLFVYAIINPDMSIRHFVIVMGLLLSMATDATHLQAMTRMRRSKS